MTPPVTNAVLEERLKNIEEYMREQRGTLKEILERLSQVEKREISCQAISSGRIESAHARLDRVEEKVKSIEKVLNELIMTNRILKWLLGIFTAVAAGILIALARGDLVVIAK